MSASALLALLCVSYASARSVVVDVDISMSHPIAPYVYGANFATQQLLNWGVGVNRNSGDDMSKYNWKIDYSNSANDYYWMNGRPFKPNQPPTPANTSFVDVMAQSTVSAGSIYVGPINTIGWVVARPESCWSFSVAQYGRQQQEMGDAGNGVYPNGTELRANWKCFKRFGIADVVEWLQHMEQVLGHSAFTNQVWLQWDNEPDCFSEVHRDAHPIPFGYDELWQTTLTYGAIIKQLYPNIKMNGPSWSNYCWLYWVRGDGCGGTNGIDYKQHGSIFVVPWLLIQVDDYYQATGVQLLDSFDMHYYPNAIPGDDSTPQHQQMILDEVRSLYDPTYVDPGNVGRCGAACLGPAIALLPRLQQMMAKYAPHLNIPFTISEYAWGFDDNVYTAALATAEVMALMGQWNALMSARWIAPSVGTRVEQSFKLFLNYDGNGKKVIGNSCQTMSSATPNQTVYSIYNNITNELNIIAFNRDLDDKSSSDYAVTIHHASLSAFKSTSAITYLMTPSAWQLTRSNNVTVTASSSSELQLSFSLTPRSLTLIVISGVTTTQATQFWLPSAQIEEFDPASLPLLSEEAKKANTEAVNEQKRLRQMYKRQRFEQMKLENEMAMKR